MTKAAVPTNLLELCTFIILHSTDIELILESIEHRLCFLQDTDPESNEAIRNLVLLVASLSFCGHTELPPASVAATSSLYQLPDFEMPVPENRGSTVRNLQAFQVPKLKNYYKTDDIHIKYFLSRFFNLFSSNVSQPALEELYLMQFQPYTMGTMLTTSFFRLKLPAFLGP